MWKQWILRILNFFNSISLLVCCVLIGVVICQHLYIKDLLHCMENYAKSMKFVEEYSFNNLEYRRELKDNFLMINKLIKVMVDRGMKLNQIEERRVINDLCFVSFKL